MTKLSKVVIYDLLFQFRHGFYFAYLFVSIIYIMLLKLLPEHVVELSSILIVFSDPSFLGFFFIGGILLLERNQGVHAPLFVTPFQVRHYLWGKAVSLSVLSVMSSFFILFFIHGIKVNVIPLLFGIILLSFIFTFLGMFLAVRVQTVNQFLFASPLFVILLFLPVVFFVYKEIPFWLAWLPSYSGLIVISSGFTPVSFSNILFSFLTLGSWVGISYIMAHQAFQKHVVKKIGGEA